MQKIMLAMGYEEGVEKIEAYIKNKVGNDFYFTNNVKFRESILKDASMQKPDIIVIREKITGSGNISEIIYDLRQLGVRVIFLPNRTRQVGDALLSALVSYGVFDILTTDTRGLNANELVKMIREPSGFQYASKFQNKVLIDETSNEKIFKPNESTIVKTEVVEVYVERENNGMITREKEKIVKGDKNKKKKKKSRLSRLFGGGKEESSDESTETTDVPEQILPPRAMIPDEEEIAEQARIEAERLAEQERLAEEERVRAEELARLQAEAERKKKEEAEALELERRNREDAMNRERVRLEEERKEANRLAEQERLAEKQRLDDEAKINAEKLKQAELQEKQRLEKARKEEEAKKLRLQQAEAQRRESERLKEEERLREEKRLADERAKRQQAEIERQRLAKLEEERLEQIRKSQEEEKRRIQEEAEKAKLIQQRLMDTTRELEEKTKRLEASTKNIQNQAPKVFNVQGKQKILTFVGGSNGVGNTQTAFNTAVGLAEKGFKTIYIELKNAYSTVEYLYKINEYLYGKGLDVALHSLQQGKHVGVKESITTLDDILKATPSNALLYKNYKMFPELLDFLVFSHDYKKFFEKTPDPSMLRELCFNLLYQEGYQYVVLDADIHESNPFTETAMALATSIYYTVTQDVICIGNAVEHISNMQERINVVDKIYYIINKHELPDIEMHTKDISEWLGLETNIKLIVPYANKDFINANYLGIPMILYSKNKALKKSYSDIASSIINS